MRILALCYAFPPYALGSALGMYDLLKRMSNDYRITVVTCRKNNYGKSIEHKDGILIIRLSAWVAVGIYPVPKPTLYNAKLLLAIYRREYNIVYTRTRFFFTSFIGLCYAYCKNLPMLHTEPGSDFVIHNKFYVKALSKLWDYTIGKLILKRSYCIGVSLASTSFAIRLGALRCATIYNGIDREIFYESTVRRTTIMVERH